MNQKSEVAAFYSPDTALQADKRAGRRYLLRVPIVVNWGASLEHEVRGLTQDLNDHGVSFHANADLQLGTAVELSFTVPRPFSARETFHFTGTVVRIENSGNGTKKFAVQVRKSEMLGQRSESPTEIPTLPTRKAFWFGFDVTPRQLVLPRNGGLGDQQRPASQPESFREPKLLLEWEPRWQNFVTSIRPAVARSADRLEAECDRTLALVRGPFTSLVLHFSAIVFLFLPFSLAHSGRVDIHPPMGKGSEVIYFSGPFLPELQDHGGAQYGRSGASGGSQSSNTQKIQVARGTSLAKMNVDAAKLYLPPMVQPVSNLLAMTPSKRDPSLLDRAQSLLGDPAVPLQTSDPPASRREKVSTKSLTIHKSSKDGIRLPYRRVREKRAVKRTQEARREWMKNDPAPPEQESTLDSVVKAISSAVNSVTGAKASAPAVIVSARPGSTLGLPATPNSGPLAMSPDGSAKGGLGGSGNGSGIGRGSGPGKAQAGSGPGSSVADNGSGADPFRGKSPAPGLGGAGTTDSDESSGVSIQGSTVTVRSFGSGPPADQQSARSRHPSAHSESTPTVTVVASSRSGGAMNEYGALRGTKVYSIYIATARGPAVLQYSEHSPKGQGFEDDLTAPEAIRSELPSAFTSKRFVVACEIDRSGALRNLRVLESSTSESMARMFAVLEGWRFRPALRDAEPIDVDAILGFNLEAH